MAAEARRQSTPRKRESVQLCGPKPSVDAYLSQIQSKVSHKSARKQQFGTFTVGRYSISSAVVKAATTLGCRAALSINLTGCVFVNPSMAYSDYHGTPAANAAYTAFVAEHFVVVQRRHHV